MTGEGEIIRLINMTDLERNVRTLIVCFVIAMAGLIPLRFVEVSQEQVVPVSEVQVLGATVQQEENVVVLPNAELSPEALK